LGTRRASLESNLLDPLYIGELSLEVAAQLHGGGASLAQEEQKEFALRHARLLVCNFANALDQG
jgi:hypothetical protein